MKTRKETVLKMIDDLENDLVLQQVLKDYRTYAYEEDEDIKGNDQAKKELNANIMKIEHTEKMIAWLNKELLRCE